MRRQNSNKEAQKPGLFIDDDAVGDSIALLEEGNFGAKEVFVGRVVSNGGSAPTSRGNSVGRTGSPTPKGSPPKARATTAPLWGFWRTTLTVFALMALGVSIVLIVSPLKRAPTPAGGDDSIDAEYTSGGIRAEEMGKDPAADATLAAAGEGSNESTLHKSVQAVPAVESGGPKQALDDGSDHERIVSIDRPVIGSVKGNLGDPSVVSSPKTNDWLKDRWQAASDMQGTAIKGSHWLEMDLGQPVVPTRMLLDWEAAYADIYDIQGRLTGSDPWETIVEHDVSIEKRYDNKPKHGPIDVTAHYPGVKNWSRIFVGTKHIHDAMSVDEWWAEKRGIGKVEYDEMRCSVPKTAVRYLKLTIKHAATAWGVSLWRWEVYGRPISACTPAPAAKLPSAQKVEA